MEYTVDSIFTFVKTTNLNDWFHSTTRLPNVASVRDPLVYQMAIKEYQREAEIYSKERPVQLVVQACFKGNKTYCRIKCPINPLPVKGWFETPSVNVLKKHPESSGWSLLCHHDKALLK